MTIDSLSPKSPEDLPRVAAGTAVAYDQPWLKSILHPLLIAVLVACLDTAWLALIARVVPTLAGGRGQIVLAFSILVTVLGCVTTVWLAQPGRRQRGTYRWAEFAFVLVATRLILWLATGSLPTLNALIYQPMVTLIDLPFLSAGLVVLFSWLVAIELMGDMLRLALQPDELHALHTDRIGEMIRSSNTDRPTILARIVARWVAGGILMVLAAAGLQVERPVTGFLAFTRQNIDPTVVAAILIYFLVGLVLVSQGQLALLRTRWLLDRVPAAEGVLRQWPFYVILLLLAIGLIAGLLPFGGTFLLAQILFGIFGFVFNFFLSIFRFFMGLLLLLLAAIMGESPETPLPEAPPPPPQPTLEQLPPAGADLLPAWTGGALFWTVMILFLSYAAYIYLSDRGVKFTWLTAFWQLLRDRWRLLFGTMRQWQQNMVPGRTASDQPLQEQPKVHWSKRGLDWRRLDPTQQVRYFYLTTLEQAQGRGIGRSHGETPTQYAPRLAQHVAAQQTPTAETPNDSPNELPDQQAVQKLTEAFVQARYSKKPLQKPESNALVEIWENLKVYLRL